MKNGKNVKSKTEVLLELWKRNAVVGAIVLFVCVAVYLNWNYEQEVGKTLGKATMVGSEASDPLVSGGKEQTPDTVEGNQQANESSYFSTARLNRQQARDSALSLLKDAATGENANEEMKKEANETIQTMADYTVTEAQIENLVVAKGYVDCVAFIGEESVSLAVSQPVGGITDQDTARIVDVVQQTSDFTTAQIKIIEVE